MARNRKTRLALRGAGLWDRFVNFFKTNSYKSSVSALLEQMGNEPVTAITICREPIAGALDTVLNALSLGKWEALKDQQGTDKFFHLYSIVTAGVHQYRLEKNANIALTSYSGGQAPESMPVPMTGSQSLNQMLEKTRAAMGDDRFYQYDAFQNNCQDFMMNFLQANGLLTTDLQTFIKQDITELTKEMPTFTKSVANLSTSIGHIVGAGQRRGRHSKPATARKSRIRECDRVIKRRVRHT